MSRGGDRNITAEGRFRISTHALCVCVCVCVCVPLSPSLSLSLSLLLSPSLSRQGRRCRHHCGGRLSI